MKYYLQPYTGDWYKTASSSLDHQISSYLYRNDIQHILDVYRAHISYILFFVSGYLMLLEPLHSYHSVFLCPCDPSLILVSASKIWKTNSLQFTNFKILDIPTNVKVNCNFQQEWKIFFFQRKIRFRLKGKLKILPRIMPKLIKQKTTDKLVYNILVKKTG